ncbi:hypothetical protein GCM10023197_11450 [Gordonia humi]
MPRSARADRGIGLPGILPTRIRHRLPDRTDPIPRRCRRDVTYPAVADRGHAMTPSGGRIASVVLFFEILLGLATVLIVWFALYTVYRLVNDES